MKLVNAEKFGPINRKAAIQKQKLEFIDSGVSQLLTLSKLCLHIEGLPSPLFYVDYGEQLSPSMLSISANCFKHHLDSVWDQVHHGTFTTAEEAQSQYWDIRRIYMH